MTTETKFTPDPADESVRKLRVFATDHAGNFRIENGPGRFGGEFDRHYVALSGYCGPHSPWVFAAAPELYEALQQAVEEIEDLRNYANNHGAMIDEVRCDYGRAALSKARGEA